jgi:molybdopterin synthase catalytic subunit
VRGEIDAVDDPGAANAGNTDITDNIDVEPLFSHEPLTAAALAEVHDRWAARPEIGGVVSFVGQVRADAHEGGRVTAIEFTAHEQMAQAAVRELADELAAEFGGDPSGAADSAGDAGAADSARHADAGSPAIFVRHRLGRVAVGEYPVIIVVGAPHRQVAYEVSRRVIDGIKERAPIFGKELLDAGGHLWKQA